MSYLYSGPTCLHFASSPSQSLCIHTCTSPVTYSQLNTNKHYHYLNVPLNGYFNPNSSNLLSSSRTRHKMSNYLQQVCTVQNMLSHAYYITSDEVWSVLIIPDWKLSLCATFLIFLTSDQRFTLVFLGANFPSTTLQG